MESDLGRGGSWCLEDPCLLTLTSPWPRLTTRACWWRPCTGTEAVETSLHCEDTMEAVSISAEGPIVNTTIYTIMSKQPSLNCLIICTLYSVLILSPLKVVTSPPGKEMLLCDTAGDMQGVRSTLLPYLIMRICNLNAGISF